jgi:ATP-binding cassette subfamily B protein
MPNKTITKPFSRLFQLIQSEKKEISSIYFYAILSGLVQLSVPLGIQAIIGFVLGASMVTSIFVLIILVVFGVLLVGVFQLNQMKIIEKIQQKIFAKNAIAFAEKIPRFDLKKIDNLYLPETVNKFFDTLNVQKGLSKILLDIPTSSIQIIFGLLLLCFYHPIFIAFGLVLLLILWIILKLTSKQGVQTSLEESSYKYSVVGWFEEMSRVIKSFKFSQGSHLNLQKTDENLLGYLTARTKHFNILVTQYKTLIFFKVAIITSMLTVGTYLLLKQQLNIGEFIATEIVIITIIGAVEKLISSLENIYDVITGLEKIAYVIEAAEEKSGNQLLHSNSFEIKFSNLNFAYHQNENILKNINLIIPSNSLIKVTGNENSGKSSFLKILTGNYQDFEGSLMFNNLPINNYQLESLRNTTGIYLSEQEVFNGTILQNITMGKAVITTDEIIDIATKIGIEDFLQNTQNGFDTKLDPTGKNISKSLIKKILLLRALVQKPTLLLLEEPWQGLTQNVKNKLIQYLQNTTSNCTVIVISQDKDFEKYCTGQINFDNGFANFKTLN